MSDTKPTLVILPGAGSYGSEFRGILKAFRPNARLLRYPWRDPPYDGGDHWTFDRAARSCAAQVRDTASGPTVLLGHSFGAYLAYAAAAILQRAGRPPARTILVAAAAPHLLAGGPQPKTRGEIEAYWRRVEPGQLDRLPDESWKEVVVETTRSDLTVFESFADTSFGRLDGPLRTAAGRDDPLLAADHCAAWSAWADGSHRHRTFAGGHSDLLADRAFVDWIDAETQRTKEAHHVSN